jgi:hypothetical protein
LENHVVERASVLAFNLFASIARARKKLAVQRACGAVLLYRERERSHTQKHTFDFLNFQRRQQKKKYANPKYFKKA